MKNKRVLVLGVVLVLLALVATVVFAGSKDGVYWAVIEGRSPRLNQSTSMYTEVYNDNNYAVRVDLTMNSTGDVLHRDLRVAAKETIHVAGSYYVSRVRQ